jgi:hypothetical protein
MFDAGDGMDGEAEGCLREEVGSTVGPYCLRLSRVP